ncbi:MAG: DnaJ domain-containing protein [bacterium]|nr:DnaJ domain-containing protein [bacterium]
MFKEGNFENNSPTERQIPDYAKMDYYKRLGISRDATLDQIQEAFQSFALENHPDRGGDTAAFQFVSEAYATLKDEGKRAAYNAKLEYEQNIDRQNNQPAATQPATTSQPRPSFRRERTSSDPVKDVQRAAQDINRELNDIMGDIFKGF